MTILLVPKWNYLIVHQQIISTSYVNPQKLSYPIIFFRPKLYKLTGISLLVCLAREGIISTNFLRNRNGIYICIRGAFVKIDVNIGYLPYFLGWESLQILQSLKPDSVKFLHKKRLPKKTTLKQSTHNSGDESIGRWNSRKVRI